MSRTLFLGVAAAIIIIVVAVFLIPVLNPFPPSVSLTGDLEVTYADGSKTIITPQASAPSLFALAVNSPPLAFLSVCNTGTCTAFTSITIRWFATYTYTPATSSGGAYLGLYGGPTLSFCEATCTTVRNYAQPTNHFWNIGICDNPPTCTTSTTTRASGWVLTSTSANTNTTTVGVNSGAISTQPLYTETVTATFIMQVLTDYALVSTTAPSPLSLRFNLAGAGSQGAPQGTFLPPIAYLFASTQPGFAVSYRLTSIPSIVIGLQYDPSSGPVTPLAITSVILSPAYA